MGKERDEETGLYYYGARYYAAWIARFVSVDPLQHKYPIYTPYQYAGNKPITFIDLDGLEEWKKDNGETQNPASFENEIAGPISDLEKEKSLNTTKGLYVGGDTTQSLLDLQSSLPESYRDMVSIDDGKVIFDITEKDMLASGDLGVETLYSLVNSDSYYFFGVDEENTIEEWKKDLDTGKYLAGYSPQIKTEYLNTVSSNGVSGATKDGIWNVFDDARKIIEVDKINRKGKKVGTKRISKKYSLEQGGRSLRKDVDNERIIAQIGKKFKIGDSPISREAVVLHELREMYYQTEKGMKRDEAHEKTLKDVRRRLISTDKRYENVQN